MEPPESTGLVGMPLSAIDVERSKFVPVVSRELAWNVVPLDPDGVAGLCGAVTLDPELKCGLVFVIGPSELTCMGDVRPLLSPLELRCVIVTPLVIAISSTLIVLLLLSCVVVGALMSHLRS